MTHQSAAVRLVGLDAWRAGLMLGGLLYHALPGGSDGVLFLLINYLSSHFRMGGFFAISGFLSGVVTVRRGAESWIKSRLTRLLPPLISGALLTITSLALLAHRSVDSWAAAADLASNWYHIWFLVALIAYLPAASWVAFGGGGQWLHRHLLAAGAATGSLQGAVIAATSIASFAGLTIGAALIVPFPAASESLLKYLPLALCYLPLFTVGLLLARNPDLCEACLRSARLPCAIIAVLLAIEALMSFFAPPRWEVGRVVLDLLNRAVLPVPGMLLILRSALAIRSIPLWVSALCDASLTIYIIHLPIIGIFYTLLNADPLHPYFHYIHVVFAAASCSWGIHVFVIRRSPTLLWLFNGRRRSATRAKEAPRLG